MTDKVIVESYSKPMMGGELPYFVGKQYGSGILSTIGKFAFPLLKRVGRFAMNTAKDVLVDHKPIKESLKDNALNEVKSVFQPNNPPTKRRKIINKHRKAKGTIFAK